FLRRLEDVVGRERFDRFLRGYIDRFRFKSITTENFLAFLSEAMPEVKSAVNVGEWIDGTGVPADAPTVRSGRLERIDGLVKGWKDGTRPPVATLKSFHPFTRPSMRSNLP